MILLLKLLRLIGLYSVNLLGLLTLDNKTMQVGEKYLGDHLTTEKGKNDSKKFFPYDMLAFLEKK